MTSPGIGGVIRRVLPDALFFALFLALLLAQVFVLVPGISVMRLWEDEAFNLTVPVNLLAGLGYTSDGTLSGSELTPFDPRISTGPVVLLPIAAVLALGGDLVIGARAVMLVFYLGLLAGLWMLGLRIGRASGSPRVARWAALAAVSVPLTLNAANSASPIQSPVDVLGEVPAAALLVWALYFAQSRPWLAGLLVGLAMHAKTIAVLGAPAIAVAVFLAVPGAVWSRALRVVRCGLFALAPLVAFELWKLASLGPSGYFGVSRAFVAFVISGGQDVGTVPPAAKIDALLSSWFVDRGLVLVLFVLAVLVAVLLWRGRVLRGAAANREVGVLFVASLLGLATWTGWWIASSHTPVWVRHPSPGLFAFVSILAAFLVLGIALLWRDRSARSAPVEWLARGTAVATSVALFCVVALAVQGHLNIASTTAFNESLGAQREAAARVAELDEPVLASSWGPEVAVTVLSGARAALSDAPGTSELPRLLRNYDQSSAGVDAFDARLAADCTSVPVRAGAYAVCIPPKA